MNNYLNFFRNKRRVIAIVILALVVLGGYVVYEKYFHLTQAEKAQQELATAIAAVSKVMVLPEGDQPVLATVTDAKTLIAQQTFFAGSANGDQLLLFPKSMKAIIWSPSREKIINVGPIQQSPSPSAVSQSSTKSNAPVTQTTTTLSVEIRNGTGQAGYASSIAQQLSSNAAYKVLKVTDAAKNGYAKNMVINLSNDQSKASLASSLAAALGADISSTLPVGEKETTADVLVILGGKNL